MINRTAVQCAYKLLNPFCLYGVFIITISYLPYDSAVIEGPWPPDVWKVS
jgi:hypothetical protein